MIALAYYLIKVMACSGILYVYYCLALRNRLFHQWNRFYLLFAVAASLALPSVRFGLFDAGEESTGVEGVVYVFGAADAFVARMRAQPSTALTPEHYAVAVYAVVTTFLLALFAAALLKIRRMIERHAVHAVEDIRFVPTNEQGTPFSFFRYVFWNEAIDPRSANGRRIFEHELVHVRERHSWDKVAMQTVCGLFWYNPFFWLVRRELAFLHEFIADKKAVGIHGAEALAAMVSHAAYPQRYNGFVNPFFQTSIKRRLTMLTKIHNPKRAYAGRLAVLPLALLTVFVFSFRAKQQPRQKTVASITHNVSVAKSTALTDLLPMVSDTPPKGKKEISTVDVQTKKTITITYTDGTSETLTEAEANARGLIHNSGYGNQSTATGTDTRISINGLPDKPLYVLNGKEIKEAEMKALDPATIAAIDVLKGAPAVKLYGERGRNGVVVITTKDASLKKPLYILDGKEVNESEVNSVDPKKIESVNVLKDASAITKYGEKGKNGVVEITLKKDGVEVRDVITRSQPNDQNTVARETVVSSEPIFTESEQPASIDPLAWRKFLESNLQSVTEAVAKQGAVGTLTTTVRFVVNTDGSVTHVTAVNDPGYELGKKIVELVERSPRWIPASQNGHSVRSYVLKDVTVVIRKAEEVTTGQQPNTTPEQIKQMTLHQLAGLSSTEELIYLDLSIDNEQKDIEVAIVKGGGHTTASKKILAMARKGKILTVDSIRVKRNGKEIQMPSKVYSM